MTLHRLPLLVLLVLSLALAGCPREAAAPAGAPTDAQPAPAAPGGDAAAVADVAPEPAAAPVAEPAPAPATAPPAEAAPPPAAVAPAAGEVDRRCSVDADCAIKDVGSCCGYRPACVNVDSPTFAKQVQAKCAEDGRMSTCGFPAISSCRCVEGQCAAAGDGAAAVQ